MPRPVSQKVQDIKQTLITRLEEGFYQPGDHFMSNRALAARFGITYQTAHRIISQLVDSGWLTRTTGSGTYIRGNGSAFNHALLLFGPRAKRKDSFGKLLLDILVKALKQQSIPYKVSYATDKPIPRTAYPVLWNMPEILQQVCEEQRYALQLHNRPPPGIAASFVDSICTDNYSGGAAAGELLKKRFGCSHPSVIGGPQEDSHSKDRIAGFRLSFPRARIVPAGSWYYEDAAKVMKRAFSTRTDSLFCCNDRLAQAALDYVQAEGIAMPPIIGFDNAPVAEELHLNTIAIPFEEIGEHAASIIKRRLRESRFHAIHHSVAPRPILRRV